MFFVPRRSLADVLPRQRTSRYDGVRGTRRSCLRFEQLEDRTLLAVTFVVDSIVDSVDANPGDGIAEDAQGFTSLRAAVMEANALAGDDTILLAPGSHQLSLAGSESDATNDLDITSNITIAASGGGPTSVVGTGNDRVLQVHSAASLTLSGVTITGGNTAQSGGGIYNDGGTVQLIDTTVFANTAASGGGIASSGHLVVTRSTISGNTGGGILNDSAALLMMTRSTISHNTAGTAAGVENHGTALVDNTIIAGNTGTLEDTDVSGTFVSGGHNLIGNTGTGAGVSGFNSDDFVGTGDNPIDPRLAPIADNGGTSLTHALRPGSVAIDGGKNGVADLSGNGNTASIIGNVTAGSGVPGSGADFPGGVGDVADDYISLDVERIPADQIPSSAVTIAAWARIMDTGFRQTIFTNRVANDGFNIFAEILPDETARFALRDNNATSIINFIGGSVPLDEWFHYASSYDQASNQVAVYLNGTPIFTGPATQNLAIGNDWDLGATIGARIASTNAATRPFTGQLDEFYIFKRALSSTEIATLATPPPLASGMPQVTGDLSIYYSFDDVITTTTDQRGGPRVLDGDGLMGPRIDIGALERVNDFNPNDPIPEQIQAGSITVHVSPIASDLVSPTLLTNAGDGSGRMFITDQIGLVYLIKNGTFQTTPFLDITDLVRNVLSGNEERGLTGLAFHPDFGNAGTAGYGRFYTWADELIDNQATVDFTHFPLAPGVVRAAQAVLREWTMNNISDDTFNGTSRELLRIDQPHQAHSAGDAIFGPDGYLYLSLGDGGTHDDQGPGHIPETGNARVLTAIHGKILRIDPMGNNSANGKYGIPPDNPFVADPEAIDEIFFYGLRNPFRFSFELDANRNKTTKIIIGDTGQDDLEEVDRADIIEDAGGHFGWNLKEGTFLFDPGPPPGPGGELRIGVTADSPGSPLGLIDPIVQYDHGPNGEGTAVLGGFTYQGDLIPELKGKYVFGDFNETFSGPNVPNGRIFYADFNDPDPEIFELNLEGAQLSGGGGVSMFIKSFGIDEAGELYVLGSTTLQSADISGLVLKLTPTVPRIMANPPAGLETSEDGGTAALNIVLTTQPTHDVTIAIASDNIAEGTVSTNSVTFTPADWNAAQTVIITGVDDDIDDGPMPYHVVLGPVTSSDLEYSALDPDDVSAFNLDDEVSHVVGDMDLDGDTDMDDIDAFVLALQSAAAYENLYGVPPSTHGDTDGDGDLDFDDIAGFLKLI